MNERAAPPGSGFSEVGSNGPRPHEALVFATLGDRNLVFSEARQAVYELSETAAHLWRSLDDGRSGSDLLRELIEGGIDGDQAASAVEAASQDLANLRGEPAAAVADPLARRIERLVPLTISIASAAVQLHLSEALVSDVVDVFGHLVAEVPETDHLLCAEASGGTVRIFTPGQPDWSCERSQFIPLLKAQLIDAVLRSAAYEVALHAAALARNDTAVLLVGSPGAGKTTLAIALTRAGFDLLADDVALLDERGLVRGVPLPFTAKASSWPLLSHHWPGITDQRSHCRPDGKVVCYIPHPLASDRSPRPINAVILLNREEKAAASVEERDLFFALSILVAEGATRDERLSPAGFTALVEGLRKARCYRLTYSGLPGAAAAVCSLCA
jgi:hypothetical protein